MAQGLKKALHQSAMEISCVFLLSHAELEVKNKVFIQNVKETNEAMIPILGAKWAILLVFAFS